MAISSELRSHFLLTNRKMAESMTIMMGNMATGRQVVLEQELSAYIWRQHSPGREKGVGLIRPLTHILQQGHTS